jgi:hypothetical protein
MRICVRLPRASTWWQRIILPFSGSFHGRFSIQPSSMPWRRWISNEGVWESISSSSSSGSTGLPALMSAAFSRGLRLLTASRISFSIGRSFHHVAGIMGRRKTVSEIRASSSGGGLLWKVIVSFLSWRITQPWGNSKRTAPASAMKIW